MARGDTAVRLLKIIMYLETSPEGLTVKEIENRLISDGIEISERTIYRDLEVIQGAHFPMVVDEDKSSLAPERRWKFARVTALTEKIHFANHEIFALYLARESLKSLSSSPLMKDILNMTDKLEKALGPGVEKELRNLSDYVAYKATATWQTGVSQEILDTVYQACWDGVVIELTYRSKSGQFMDQIKLRRLGPETLYFAGGGGYLIAKDLTDNKVKTYSLNRIIEANYTEEEYQSTGFKIEDYIKDNFGILSSGTPAQIELFITDPIASYVSERRWHDSQQITRVDRGIQFRMYVNINDELIRWILGLGPAAKVISPLSLAQSVQDAAEAISQHYAAKKAVG